MGAHERVGVLLLRELRRREMFSADQMRLAEFSGSDRAFGTIIMAM